MNMKSGLLATITVVVRVHVAIIHRWYGPIQDILAVDIPMVVAAAVGMVFSCVIIGLAVITVVFHRMNKALPVAIV
jgi:hypothetical protein